MSALGPCHTNSKQTTRVQPLYLLISTMACFAAQCLEALTSSPQPVLLMKLTPSCVECVVVHCVLFASQ